MWIIPGEAVGKPRSGITWLLVAFLDKLGLAGNRCIARVLALPGTGWQQGGAYTW
jgi:hypothetical protein